MILPAGVPVRLWKVWRSHRSRHCSRLFFASILPRSNLKRCSKCGLEKGLGEFSPTTAYKDRRCCRSECKACNAVEARSRYARNPASAKMATDRWRKKFPTKIFATRLRYKYGLSISDYERLLQVQEHKCAICQGTLKKPHIDHCHTSGKVRGLLCLTCNTGLGKFRDSFLILKRAAIYVNLGR